MTRITPVVPGSAEEPDEENLGGWQEITVAGEVQTGGVAGGEVADGSPLVPPQKSKLQILPRPRPQSDLTKPRPPRPS